MARLALLLAIALSACAGPRRAADAIDRYREAARLEEKGDLQGALRALERLGRDVPAFAKAHAARGNLFRRLGRPADAREAYDAALRADPAEPAALAGRGLLNQIEGRPSEAEADFTALAAGPGDSVEGLLLRARLYRSMGRFSEAARDQGEAQALTAGNWARFYNAGAAAFRAERWAEAALAYEMTLLVAPAVLEADLGLAAIALRQGRPDEALDRLSRTAAARPSEASVAYARAEVLRSLGRAPEAIAEYSRALQLGPHPIMRVGRGQAQELLGRPDLAFRDYDEAIREEPALREAWIARARLHRTREALPEAEQDLLRAVALSADVETLVELAGLAAARGEAERSEKYFDMARQLAGTDRRAEMDRAWNGIRRTP